MFDFANNSRFYDISTIQNVFDIFVTFWKLYPKVHIGKLWQVKEVVCNSWRIRWVPWMTVCIFFNMNSLFLSRNFFARSIKLLSCCCCCGGTLVPFEHGWSYRKNSNAGKFVFPYWFIHKNFWLVRGPVFCPVSGFCTSDGPIKKITMQATLYSHTGSSIKISG